MACRFGYPSGWYSLGPSPVFDLFLLGLDSAFAFMEGILTVTSDTEYFKDTPKWKMSGATALFRFSCPSCAQTRGAQLAGCD
jgi:hypothetical protein